MKRNLFAVGAILACMAAGPVMAGDGFKEGDFAIGGLYSYVSPDADFDARQSIIGASGEYWIVDDLSAEVQLAVPKGDPGSDTLSFAGRLNYGFGPVYIPLEVAYWNGIDSLAFGTGMGVNFLAGPVNLRFEGSFHYLEDSDLPDRTALQVTGAVRFRF